MALLEGSDAYWRFAGTCTQCGHCTGACESLTAAGMSLGDIAKALLDAQRASSTKEELAYAIATNGQLVQAVRGCFFCTSCKNTCFAHNDVCDLIYRARVDFQNLGLIPREAWSSVLVDQEWDIFTAYRAIHGIGYVDLVRHKAYEGHEVETGLTTAFFPGCSLAAYGPELCREIFDEVDRLADGRATMIDSCCGSSLKSAGFFDRAEALCDRNADELAAAGARELVCVCPGCANDMRKALAARGLNVKVELLAGWLAERGFAPKHPLPEGTICLSKSCQDRDGSYVDEVRAVLGLAGSADAGEGAADGADAGTDAAAPAREVVIYRGCCGAGGAVSAFDPARQAEQADGKLSFAPDGSTVVSMCPTCTYTYAYRLMEAPRAVTNKHYCELLFDSQFDWDKTFAQLGGMWSGEYGPWLAQVFA
ncbi:MAG TPA: (Fe-S)-binding protein [Candidatus Aphodovivens avistercoris]|nr:(Fe-S)-binding protein [Candidatus Aphodovivens avistercoris]